MLELAGVRFQYPAMKRPFEFDLQVKPGQILGVMGKSGSGKSTLLDLIAGFQNPTRGRVTWNCVDFHHLPPEQRPVTILFQNHNLFEHLSVERNISIGIDPSGRVDNRAQNLIQSALNEVGLSGFEGRIAATLSGGQQQRVALARALLRQQPILLLDEPCTGLDEETRREILLLIKDMAVVKGRAVLLATHEPDDITILNADLYRLDALP